MNASNSNNPSEPQATNVDTYINPQCVPANLDLYMVRKSIRDFLAVFAPKLRGVILDVGCGKMPYRDWLLSQTDAETTYVGIDIRTDLYPIADVIWDGCQLPVRRECADHVLLTEVLEHVSHPETLLRETHRVLKPGGEILITVPFIWPLHDEPYDEYRYTPYSLRRILYEVGFDDITLNPLTGWDGAMAQMIGLWVRRRPMSSGKRRICSWLAWPVVYALSRSHYRRSTFDREKMFGGIVGLARK